MSWFGSKNLVGDFNTQGQTKCDRCGGYYPERWASHGSACTNPPQDDD